MCKNGLHYKTKSLKRVQERFSDKYLEKSTFDKKSVLLLERYSKHDTVRNLPHKRIKTVLLPQTLATLEENLTANPGPSLKLLCCVAMKEELSYSTTYQGTAALNLHSYCVPVVVNCYHWILYE